MITYFCIFLFKHIYAAMLLLGEVWSWSCTKIMDRSKAVSCDLEHVFVDIGKEVLGWKTWIHIFQRISRKKWQPLLPNMMHVHTGGTFHVLRITRCGLQPQGVLARWVRRYVTITFGCVDLFGDEIADMVRTWAQMAGYSPWSAADSLQDSLSTLRTPTLGVHWKEHLWHEAYSHIPSGSVEMPCLSNLLILNIR